MIRRISPSSMLAQRPIASSILLSSRSSLATFQLLSNRPYASEAVETSQVSTGKSEDAKVPIEEDFGGDGPLEPAKPRTPPIEACFYVSQIFPIKLGKLDPRPLLASIRKDQLLDQFPLIASHPSLRALHSFTLLSTEKQPKDGGVFLRFSFVPPSSSSSEPSTTTTDEERAEHALQEIEDRLKQVVRETQGGFKTWSSTGGAKLWRVRGRPWHEDLSRFASNRVKVTFEGGDVNQEALYDLTRPYGHISNLVAPTTQPALTLRYSMLTFSRLSSAAAAVSCLHGLSVSPKPPKTRTLGAGGGGKQAEGSVALEGGPTTRLAFSYESPLKAHAARDWISSHPRIALPAFVAMLGTLSYTFFDPIREFMISSKILDRFSIERSSAFKALRSLASTILPSFFPPPPPKPPASIDNSRRDNSHPGIHDESLVPAVEGSGEKSPKSDSAIAVAAGADEKPALAGGAGEGEANTTGAWRERKEAEKMVEGWLRESPSGFILVTGPSGSGKLALVQQVIEKENKRSLVIDCSQIAKGKSEQAMVTELASETGYWPFFGFLASANGMIDLASVGLIGQKAGFSSDFPTQLKAILDVVTSSLKSTSEHELSLKKGVIQNESERAKREAEQVVFRERLKRIGYHDPRIDSICGNGIMSELGFGDEQLTTSDLSHPSDALYLSSSLPPPLSSPSTLIDGVGSDSTETENLDHERDTIEALPVVVLKGFAQKGSKKDELWTTIAEWAGAGLIENRISQVIVIADNSSASKPLSKALPSRPLNIISLADADKQTSLNFVAGKLKLGTPGHATLTEEEKSRINVLGGRMNDLEQLVFKVRTGLSVSAAVEDIVVRSETELRKSFFGDDSSESKSLPWTRSQAWSIVSALASKGEVAYQSLLVGFPFKGAEDQLKALEAAELISVQSINGRPSTIRTGKPLYREALKRLVADPVFAASNLFTYNSELLAKQEALVEACEKELVQLKDIAGTDTGFDGRLNVGNWLTGPSAIELRVESVMGRMKAAQVMINELELQIEHSKLVCKTHH